MPTKEKMKSNIKNNSSTRAIVCLDGEAPSKKTFQKINQENDFIVAADGAANWLYSYGVTPDIVIGDLDGIKKSVLKKIPGTKLLRIADQYSTDLEKVVSWTIDQKFTDLVIVGIAGKRIDHTLSNFQLIWKFVKKIRMEFVHDDWSAIPIQREKKIFEVEPGMTISLIPASACKGITLRGFKYNLTNASMKLGEVGVSNIAEKNKVSVEVTRGSILALFLA